MACNASFIPEVKVECIGLLVSSIKDGSAVANLPKTLQLIAAITGSAAALLPQGGQNLPIHLTASEVNYDEADEDTLADELTALLGDKEVAQLGPNGVQLSTTVGADSPATVQTMNPIVAQLLLSILTPLLAKLLGKLG